MDFFANFKVSKPEFNLLPVGEHLLKVIRAEEVTSFQQFSGDEKVELPEWQDATPQLAITVVAAEKGKSGGLTHRFNGRGYVRMSELSEEQRNSGEYQDVDGYACSLNDDGQLVREVSEQHTKECANIINQFAASLGLKETDKKDKSTYLGAQLKNAIAEGKTFYATVVNKPYKGKDQLRLSSFKAVKNVTVKADFED